MKILIDIGHPAHVHIFKNLSWILIKKNHNILFTTRDKEYEIQLLKKYGFYFKSLGKHKKSILGKIFGLVYFDLRLIFVSLKFKPDLYLSHGSPYAAQVSWLFRKPHIALEDTGNLEQIKLFLPFTDVILTSYSYKLKHGIKQIYYDGYHELAYLHPNRFTPDSSILDLLGVQKDEKYIIFRFVSWNASHDVGQSGLSNEMKIKAVKELSKYAKVFISSEGELPDDLKTYQIKIPPEKMHDALAFATLFLGEGATMASECACLGTPAIYVNSLTAGALEEQEKYGLLFGFRNSYGVIEKAIELLNTPNLKEEWQYRRQRMLQNKIDVTAFLVWFIENYPDSVKIMKENPNYQYNFK